MKAAGRPTARGLRARIPTGQLPAKKPQALRPSRQVTGARAAGWYRRPVPSSSYVDHALELLAGLGPVRARAMMGGHIVHCGRVAIALVYDDRLYLKTDEETRDTFIAAGGEPFTYELRGKVVEMSYCTPPDEALDSAEAMQPWADRALAAAIRKRRPPKITRNAARRSSPPTAPRRRRPARSSR